MSSLAKAKEINSTEKLLNVIRGAKPPFPATPGSGPNISFKKKPSLKITANLFRFFNGKRPFQVGVDIGANAVTMVKMRKTSDGKSLLVDQKVVKFGEGISKKSPEFNTLLKSSLTAFAGSLDDCDIWAMMSAAEVNVFRLKIPIVPANQMENVIYWAAKKENPIDEKEAFFDYEVQGKINDQGIPKYAVMVYSAPRSEPQKVKDLFSSIGVSLTGVTIAPFAIQNYFRTEWIKAGEGAFAGIFIGHDFSRIDIYRKNDLVMTRVIKTGISSMMEAIDDAIAEASPGAREEKERAKALLNEIAADPEKWMKEDGGVNWAETGILEMTTPALERLLRQIERTMEYFATSVGFEKVEKVYLSAAISVFYYPLLHYLREQIGSISEYFDPFAGKSFPAKSGLSSLAERASLIPAIGLALSDSKHTPNAIFTYAQKKQELIRKRINRGVFSTFAAALAVCLVIMALQVSEARQLGVQKGKLEKELLLLGPKLSKDKIAEMAKEMKIRNQHNQRYSQKYKGLALISELSFLTPDDIRLTQVRMSIPEPGAGGQTTGAAGKEAAPKENLVLQGVVLGSRGAMDAQLAQYVMKLENSPMLQGVVLQKSSVAKFRNSEILQFVINAKIG